MKTYCKTDLLHDRQFCFERVKAAFHRKWGRKNYQRALSQYSGLPLCRVRAAVRNGDKDIFDPALYAIADEFLAELDARRFEFPPVIYRDRVDGLSGKTRAIGIMSVKQQCFEHIVVGALTELFDAKIEANQYASIKGRGQVAGMKKIRKWIRSDLWSSKCAARHGGHYSRKATKYVKLDVEKCFPSISRETVMYWLSRDIRKNRLLLWAVDEILTAHEAGGRGLIIGSLLSQFLCNYLMSYAYREVMSYAKVRRGQRVRYVFHAIFFMDDILLIGSDRRDMKRAVRGLTAFMGTNLGLTVKPKWHIKDIEAEPIDMMGFVIHADGSVTIRDRIFLRVRRSFQRARRRTLTNRSARRIVSYYGYIKHTNSRCLRSSLGVNRTQKMARRTIRRTDREGEKNYGTKSAVFRRIQAG